MIENGEKRIAVKPICEALGIAFEPQFTRLKTDPIIGSTVTMIVTVGADGKQREMVTIPFEYVFGWLFLIDSRKVSPEAKDSVLRYQKECYHALYNYFTRHDEYLEWRDKVIAERLTLYDAARLEFRDAKDKVLDARDLLNEARKITEENYFADKDQLRIQFGEESEVSHG